MCICWHFIDVRRSTCALLDYAYLACACPVLALQYCWPKTACVVPIVVVITDSSGQLSCMTLSTLLIWCCCFHCHGLFYFLIICHAMTIFCSVLRTHVAMSAICIFGVVSLFSVRVLYFSCCSLVSVVDEFLLSWDFRYYCVKNKKSFPFRWISSCCEESLANIYGDHARIQRDGLV